MANFGVTGAVSILSGNGDGTFGGAQTYGAGGEYTQSVAVADLDGDGKADVIVANFVQSKRTEQGNVGVLRGNGDGTIRHANQFASGGDWAQWVTVADVNGDGKPDVLVVNYKDCNDCSSSSVGVLINVSRR